MDLSGKWHQQGSVKLLAQAPEAGLQHSDVLFVGMQLSRAQLLETAAVTSCPPEPVAWPCAQW